MQAGNVLTHCQEHTRARLEGYLEALDIIGLSGVWGTGKTFIVDELRRRMICENKQYDFIKIEVLSCHLNEIQGILLREIDKMLFRHGIFSQHSKALNDMLGRAGIWSKFRPLLIEETESFTHTLDSMKNSVAASGRKIVIVYEDIDRIANPATLREIFGISELIAGENIKIIYMYDADVLKKKFEMEDKYLEKYIPHVISVQGVDFIDAIDCLINNDAHIKQLAEDVNIKANSFNYITTQHRFCFGHDIDENDFSVNATIELSSSTMRTVRNFLSEALNLLKDADLARNESTTISTVFVKHFYNHIYEKWERMKLEGESRFHLLDALYFEHSDPSQGTVTARKLKDNYLDDVYTNRDNGDKVKDMQAYIQQLLTSSSMNIELKEVLCLFHYNKLDAERVTRDSTRHDLDDAIISRILRSSTQDYNIVKSFTCFIRETYTATTPTNLTSILNMLSFLRRSAPAVTNAACGNFVEMLPEYRGTDGQYKSSRLDISDVDVFRAFYYFNGDPDDWLQLVKAFRGLASGSISCDDLVNIMGWCRIDSAFKNVYFEILEWFCDVSHSYTPTLTWPSEPGRGYNVLAYLYVLDSINHMGVTLSGGSDFSRLVHLTHDRCLSDINGQFARMALKAFGDRLELEEHRRSFTNIQEVSILRQFLTNIVSIAERSCAP